jgi:uracil phosphoribosyltransferase
MLTVIKHPVIRDRLTRLRDIHTAPAEFRQLAGQIAALMVGQATADFAESPSECATPLEITSGHRLSRPIVLVPILRAGLGLLDGFLSVLPEASVGYLGLARNEDTLRPEPYYVNLPNGIEDAEVIVLDPMLATGGSAIDAVRQLRLHGAQRLRLVCLVAAPEGVGRFEEMAPKVPIFAAALDRGLSDMGFILPGLGDAGDRLFGTPKG